VSSHDREGAAIVAAPSQIASDVRDALRCDARIKHPELISISVDVIGTVVLDGAVATIRQRRAAVSAARRVDGVFDVIDRLKVHPRVRPLQTDDEIHADALQRLAADSRIHSERIHVTVARGRATLTGYVRHTSERSHAEEDVAGADGVLGVANEIEVR
jgi:osmotically-inducible protein OsmY